MLTARFSILLCAPRDNSGRQKSFPALRSPPTAQGWMRKLCCCPSPFLPLTDEKILNIDGIQWILYTAYSFPLWHSILLGLVLDFSCQWSLCKRLGEGQKAGQVKDFLAMVQRWLQARWWSFKCEISNCLLNAVWCDWPWGTSNCSRNRERRSSWKEQNRMIVCPHLLSRKKSSAIANAEICASCSCLHQVQKDDRNC